MSRILTIGKATHYQKENIQPVVACGRYGNILRTQNLLHVDCMACRRSNQFLMDREAQKKQKKNER